MTDLESSQIQTRNSSVDWERWGDDHQPFFRFEGDLSEVSAPPQQIPKTRLQRIKATVLKALGKIKTTFTHAPIHCCFSADSDRSIIPPVHFSPIRELPPSISASHVSLPEVEPSLTLAMSSIKVWTLPQIEEAGFTSLAKKMEGKSGFPWSNILVLENPGLMEPIVDILQHIEAPSLKLSDSSKEYITMVSLRIAKHPFLQKGVNQSYLGKFLFLFSTKFAEAMRALEITKNEKDILTVLQWIDYEFNTEIQKSSERLHSHFRDHQISDIQPAEVALNVLLPREIASFLLTPLGTINTGLINPLLDGLLARNNPPFNYEVSLIYGLKKLLYSPHFREKLEKIKRPSLNHEPANDVIAISLGLPHQTEITDREAKKAVLTALLSHLRQASSNSCFATYLAIELLSSQLDKVIEDLESIIRFSKLVRKVNNMPLQFPFLLRMANKHLDKKIRIDGKGNLVSSQKNIRPYESPGIMAAYLAVGVNEQNIKTLNTTIVEKLFSKSSSHSPVIEITVRDYLKELADAAKIDSSLEHFGSEFLFSRACFAFESQTSNPLLKIWRNAIAGMAEAQDEGLIKTNVLKSILRTFVTRLDKSESTTSDLLSYVAQVLQERVQLQYDPNVYEHLKSREKYALQGAFVLYDTKGLHSPLDWFRVDNIHKFKDFLKEIISQIQSECTQEAEIQTKALVLQQSLEDPEFIPRMMGEYDPRNKRHFDGLSREAIIGLNYDELEIAHTLWITICGNDSDQVLKIYFEQTQPLETELVKVGNAFALLAKIIELGKKSTPNSKQNFDRNPYRLVPARIPGSHAFSLLLGHTTVSKAWKENSSTEGWIKKYVEEPGIQLKDSIVTELTRNKFNKKILEYVPPSTREIFSQKYKQLKENLCIQELRNETLLILEILLPLSKEENEVRIRFVDSALVNSLKGQQSQLMHQSSVHIADTNWFQGLHNIHFSIAMNPGSGQLEMWEVYDNGTHFRAIDQKYWLQDRAWEFYCHPEKIFNTDEEFNIIDEVSNV